VIETVYTLTEAEFFEGQQSWCPRAVRKLPGHSLIQGVYFVFSALVGVSVIELPLPLGIALALGFALYIALIAWRKKRIQALQFQQLGDSVIGISLKTDAFGYHEYKEGSGSCSIAWKRFTGWRETPNVFVLGMDVRFITIPKAALSQDQQNELRSLFQTSINAR